MLLSAGDDSALYFQNIGALWDLYLSGNCRTYFFLPGDMEKTDMGIAGGIRYGPGMQSGSVFCFFASIHRESAGSPDAFASDLRYHNQPYL